LSAINRITKIPDVPTLYPMRHGVTRKFIGYRRKFSVKNLRSVAGKSLAGFLAVFIAFWAEIVIIAIEYHHKMDFHAGIIMVYFILI
jgi:hypothetical protein